MKKSDLRSIILEELEKSNASLLMEKFASPILADINKRIAGGSSNSTQLWNATANTYGIAWDLVKDEHVSTGANPRREMLNIFFVEKGTENPYGEYRADYRDGKRVSVQPTFYRSGLLGITVGKKVIGFSGQYRYKDPVATKKNKRVDLDGSNHDKAGMGVDLKVWNYKRMLEISTEVFSIDITAVKDWNIKVKSLRSDQKDGATAMKQNSQILKDNKSRYQSALKDLKDAGVEGKEFDIVLAHLDDAEKILTKELKQKIKDTRKGIVYPGWDSPFELAVNLHKNMVDKFKDFQRYAKSAKKEGGSWYEQYLTDIAHEVADIKKDFDKRLARAIAQGPVPISESVLPVLGGVSKIDERNAFLGARAKAIEEDLEEFEFNGKIYPVTKKVNESNPPLLNEEYVESMDSIEIANALGVIADLWQKWKDGPMTEPSDIKPAQRELKSWINSWMKNTIK